MNDLHDQLASMQRSVRRLQATVAVLGAGLAGVVLMGAAPHGPSDLTARELKADRIVLTLNGKTTTLTGEGLTVEAGTKEAGARASLLAFSEGFVGLKLLTWSPEAQSSLHLDANRAMARLAGVSNNGRSGTDARGGAVELTTAQPTARKGEQGPSLTLDEKSEEGAGTGKLFRDRFAPATR
ncbi:MAG: hypothetical protein ACOZQL_14240 [Myxococcota bacterium]